MAYDAAVFTKQVEVAYEASRKADTNWKAVKSAAFCARLDSKETFNCAVELTETTLQSKMRKEVQLLRYERRENEAAQLHQVMNDEIQ